MQVLLQSINPELHVVVVQTLLVQTKPDGQFEFEQQFPATHILLQVIDPLAHEQVLLVQA